MNQAIDHLIIIIIIIYYETRTKVHEKEKKHTRKTQTTENIQKEIQKKHITKNTSRLV